MFEELRVGCFLESFRGLNKILNGNENTGVFCICCVGVTINQFVYIKWMEGSGGMKQLNTIFSKKGTAKEKVLSIFDSLVTVTFKRRSQMVVKEVIM